MQISIRDAGKVRILDLKGPLDLDEGIAELREAVNSLLGEGQRLVLLNMRDVDWIDSSGVGELVAVYLRAQKVAGAIKLVMLSDQVREVLVMCHLHKVFEIYEDELKAVGSF